MLATRQEVPPTPGEIVARLGASTASHALDRTSLRALDEASETMRTVRLKRELWSSLRRSALGTQFTDDPELFIEHALLVNSAPRSSRISCCTWT